MTTTTPSVRDLPLPPRVVMPMFELLQAMRMYNTGIERVRDEFGPVCMVRIGPKRLIPTLVVVSSPAGAHDVLSGRDGAADKGGIAIAQTQLLTGPTLFTMGYDEWVPRRREIQPVFTKQHVAGFAGHMASVATELAGTWTSGETIDLDLETRKLTLNVLGRSVFGQDLGKDAAQLRKSLPRVQNYVSRRSTAPVRMPRDVPTPSRWRFRRSLRNITAVVDHAVAEYLADPEHSPAELIRLLHNIIDPDTGSPFTADVIQDELVTFLAAGHDTTATTLTYSLWALGRDPAIQDRVREEVTALGARPVTVDDVSALPYTVAVLHESLRLCPPAAAIPRMAMRDIAVAGFRVPAGANILVGTYALHRDPALWPDPTRFDPDRFTGATTKGRRWDYLPFGAGPRSCIGDHFAMLEATLGLATIVRSVELESASPTFEFALPFTMTAKGRVPVRVRRTTE